MIVQIVHLIKIIIITYLYIAIVFFGNLIKKMDEFFKKWIHNRLLK
jgi:hypothetical protein